MILIRSDWSIQDLVSASMFPTESSQQGELALTSLAHVIRNNAGVEMQTIGHFKMIFSLLESQFSSVQETAISVIRYAAILLVNTLKTVISLANFGNPSLILFVNHTITLILLVNTLNTLTSLDYLSSAR